MKNVILPVIAMFGAASTAVAQPAKTIPDGSLLNCNANLVWSRHNITFAFHGQVQSGAACLKAVQTNLNQTFGENKPSRPTGSTDVYAEVRGGATTTQGENRGSFACTSDSQFDGWLHRPVSAFTCKPRP